MEESERGRAAVAVVVVVVVVKRIDEWCCGTSLFNL